MPDWLPINWGLIKSPANWLTIILMILLASFVLDLMAQYAQSVQSPDE